MILPAKNYPLNCGLAQSLFNRTFSKRVGAGGYKLEAIPSINTLSSSSSSNIAVQDRIVQRNISASYVTDYTLRAIPLINGWFQNVHIDSLSPNILSKSNNDTFVYESDGECILKGNSEEGEVVLVKATASSQSASTVDIFQSWISGSLANHCENQINSLISNKSQKNVFTIANGTSFVRNTNCWAHDVDLSCASPWNSTGQNTMAGTLVSPKHVIFCKHSNFYPNVGSTIWFVSQNNNTVVTKTLTQLNVLTDIDGIYSDVVVGTLDSDVPQFIKFAKILPSNYNSYIPGLFSNNLYYIPSLYLNQSDGAGIMMLLGLGAGISGQGTFSSNESSYYKPDNSIYRNFYIPVIRGDSGNPMFLIINGELVLLGVFSGAFSGSHISHPNNKTQINNIMATSGYQLSEIDLSSFNTY